VKAEKGVPEMYFACTLQTLGEQMDFWQWTRMILEVDLFSNVCKQLTDLTFRI
jgi:hypothetical protein